MKCGLIDASGVIAILCLVSFGSASRAEGGLLMVDASGEADKTSVQEAIDAAAPGTVIRIGPGVYEERLLIDKPITLEGAGWDKTTIVKESMAAEKFDSALMKFAVLLRNQGKEVKTREQQAAMLEEFSREYGREHAPVVVTNTDGVVLRGLKLSFPGRIIEGRLLPVPVIKFSNSRAMMSDCAIVGSVGNGVEIAGDSDVEISKCLVAAVWSNGVVGSAEKDKSGPKVRILDSDVRNCYHHGIMIRPGCDSALVQGCRISGSAWHGIRYDNSSPAIVGNAIWGNARSGIYSSGSTAATVRGNVIYRNGQNGISCWYRSADTIENNTFASNYREAVSIHRASGPTIRKNIFFSNAVVVARGSDADPKAVTVEGNLYWENGTLEKVLVKDSETGAGKQKAVEMPVNEPGALEVNPVFVEPSKGDFSLAAESPAKKAGIGALEPIAFESPWTLQPEEKAIIPDGDTRDSGEWKPPVLEKNKERSRRDQRKARAEMDKPKASWEGKSFAELLKEYRALVAELDKELAAYRASLPVFAKFHDLVAKESAWMNRAREESGQKLRQARVNWKTLKYDKEASAEMIKRILAGKLKEIYAEFQKEMEAGNLSLTDQQQRIYYQGGYVYTQSAEPLSGGWEEHIPYEKETPEYYMFVRELAMSATMFMSPLMHMVGQVPEASQAKRQEVGRLYKYLEKLKRQEKSDVDLGPKYEEEYLKKLKAVAGQKAR